MRGYSLEIDTNGIALVTFDLNGKVNVMNDEFMSVMEHLLEKLEAARSTITGIVLTSGKSTFFAGGDLALMRDAKAGDEDFLFEHFERLKGYFRQLETYGVPVVAAINGTALGGGYELCLSCHHRIALNQPKARIGLPEVNFGILPAAGGVIRLTRLLGLFPALEFLLTGKKVDVKTALDKGLIDEIVETQEQLTDVSKDWIKSNPKVNQPWDKSHDYGTEGPPASVRKEIDALNPWLQNNIDDVTRAVARIADIAAESLHTDFDVISPVETRGFVDLVLSNEAKEKITSFFEASKSTKSK